MLILIIREFKNDIALPVSVCVTVALSLVSLTLIRPVCEYVKEISGSLEYGEYIGFVMKSFAIALVTSACADICRDCGEGAIASKVELIGKCTMMLIALPVIRSILSLAKEILYA
jgi:stage III sporulation protein AD